MMLPESTGIKLELSKVGENSGQRELKKKL